MTMAYKTRIRLVAALRHRLLPKLISVELSVKNAERFVERSCA